MSDETSAPGVMRALPEWVAEVVGVEGPVEAALDGALRAAAAYPKAAEALGPFHDLAKGQREALRAHLETLGGAVPAGSAGATRPQEGPAVGGGV